jgi:hypothetical protein
MRFVIFISVIITDVSQILIFYIRILANFWAQNYVILNSKFFRLSSVTNHVCFEILIIKCVWNFENFIFIPLIDVAHIFIFIHITIIIRRDEILLFHKVPPICFHV